LRGPSLISEAAKQCIESQQAGWKNAKHAAQWTGTIETYCAPVFGNLAVADVTTDLVLRVLETIWVKKCETASRLRGRIASVLDWAKSKGYRTGDNPAAWKGHLDTILPQPGKVKAAKHFAAQPFNKMGDFMQDLRAREGIAPRALEFCILTQISPARGVGQSLSKVRRLHNSLAGLAVGADDGFIRSGIARSKASGALLENCSAEISDRANKKPS
jgi:hypothetical protein